MKRKALIMVALIFFLTSIFTGTVLAANNSEIIVDFEENKYVKIVKGRTMLPIEMLANYIGFKITYYPNSNKTKINLVKKEIQIETGNNELIVDGNVINIDTVPQVLDNRVYVPIRVIAENLGYQVDWNGTKVILNS